MKYISIIILSIYPFLFSYSQEKESTREYYFNMSHFKNPKTYIFKNSNDSTDIVSWKMYYKIKNLDTIFYTEGSRPNMKPFEIFIETINFKDAKLKEYLFINYGSLNTKEIKKSIIINNEVFNFTANDSTIIWKINFNDKDLTSTLSKKRTLTDTTILIYDNRKYECLVFKDNFSYQVPSKNIIDNFHQLSYYAKGLGLIRYTRNFSDGIILDYKLDKILNKK